MWIAGAVQVRAKEAVHDPIGNLEVDPTELVDQIREAPEMRMLLIVVMAALGLGSEMWPPATPPPPLAGFSFSPLISEYGERDPAADLEVLLDATKPDLVRLPVYWSMV